MPKTLTQEEFFQKWCQGEYFNNILFDRMKYVNYSTKVEIGCKKCGRYKWVQPEAIMHHKVGCSQCSREIGSKLRKEGTYQRHLEKFYSSKLSENFNPVKVGNILKISCKHCGRIYTLRFEAENLKCLCQRYNTKEFIAKVEEKYPKQFDFSKSTYIGATSPIIVTCRNCGKDFQTTPNRILSFGSCPQCHKLGYSKTSISLFEEISKGIGYFIQHKENLGEFQIGFKVGENHYKFAFDGYIKEFDIVLEYYGSRFHGDLRVYSKDEYPNPFNKKLTTLDLYNKTKAREKLLESQGFKVIPIWEFDVLQNRNLVIQNVINEVKDYIK